MQILRPAVFTVPRGNGVDLLFCQVAQISGALGMKPSSIGTGCVRLACHEVACQRFEAPLASAELFSIALLGSLSSQVPFSELFDVLRLLFRTGPEEDPRRLVELVGHKLLELLFRAKDFLEESRRVSDSRRVLLVAFPGCKFAEGDLTPREIILGERNGPVELS